MAEIVYQLEDEEMFSCGAYAGNFYCDFGNTDHMDTTRDEYMDYQNIEYENTDDDIDVVEYIDYPDSDHTDIESDIEVDSTDRCDTEDGYIDTDTEGGSSSGYQSSDYSDIDSTDDEEDGDDTDAETDDSTDTDTEIDADEYIKAVTQETPQPEIVRNILSRFFFYPGFSQVVSPNNFKPTGRLLSLPTELRFMIWEFYLRDNLSGQLASIVGRDPSSMHFERTYITLKYLRALDISIACKTTFQDIIGSYMYMKYVTLGFRQIGGITERNDNFNHIYHLPTKLCNNIRTMELLLTVRSPGSGLIEGASDDAEIRAFDWNKLRPLERCENLEYLSICLGIDAEDAVEPLYEEQETYQLSELALKEFRNPRWLHMVKGLKGFELSIEIFGTAEEGREDGVEAGERVEYTAWGSRFVGDEIWEEVLEYGMRYDHVYKKLQADMGAIMKQPRRRVVDNSHV